jgi:hypothetical protein
MSAILRALAALPPAGFLPAPANLDIRRRPA